MKEIYNSVLCMLVVLKKDCEKDWLSFSIIEKIGFIFEVFECFEINLIVINLELNKYF